jgi:RNA polymerase sigma factor (sigma-70 family)
MSAPLTTSIPTPQQIVREYGDKVTNLCHRMIRNRELARDTAQEVWFEVLKGLSSFRGESSFSTWLYTVAKRTIDKHIH